MTLLSNERLTLRKRPEKKCYVKSVAEKVRTILRRSVYRCKLFTCYTPYIVGVLPSNGLRIREYIVARLGWLKELNVQVLTKFDQPHVHLGPHQLLIQL